MSRVTVVLTHWKRPDGIRQVIQSLDQQTERPVIWLWNNSDDGVSIADPRIDWEIISGRNRKCWPRWWMASEADTEFVAIHDDDFHMNDKEVLGDAIRRLESLPLGTIVGRRGLRLQEGKHISKSNRVYNVSEDEFVDVPCQFTVLRTADLAKLSLRVTAERPLRELGEHVLVSGILADGEPLRHCIPKVLANRFHELPQTHALYLTPGVWDIAEEARKRVFRH